MFHLPMLESVRSDMAQEVQLDLESGALYISSRLNAQGRSKYQSLLMRAIERGDPESFTEELGMHYFNPTELRRGTPVKVPHSANATLAEGEFNRFYMRGVCLCRSNQIMIHNS